MRGPGSLNHNRRSFTAENVDPERSSLNVVYRDEPIQKVYHELFDEAVNRYNAKQECQTDLTEIQEQLETVQTAVDAAEQRMQKVEQTYQKQSQKLNKLTPIMEGLENLSAQYSQRPEEWVPEAATFETAKSYREKKAIPLIQKLVKVLFALHRKYREVKDERDKYLHFYQDEKKATHHLSQRLKEVEAENSQFYAMKRDFGRVWDYFGAEKMQQVIGLMREQEQTVDRSQKKSRQSSVEL